MSIDLSPEISRDSRNIPRDNKMAMKILNSGAYKLPRNPLHNVRFTNDELPRYKSMETTSDSIINFSGHTSYTCPDSDTTSSDNVPQPAGQRYTHNEQRIKLLQAINQIVQQRADLESSRSTLSNLLDELRKKLKRRIELCHHDKKDQLKSLLQSNLRLEKEKYGLEMEVEHIKRHLEKEEAHHKHHARKVMAQAIQGVAKGNSDQFFTSCSVANLPAIVSRNVAKNAPSKVADSKLAAARLMRDIAELRQRVAQAEARLANEMKRKRQAEVDIMRLRKKLSSVKTDVASLRLPPPLLRHQCSKFA